MIFTSNANESQLYSKYDSMSTETLEKILRQIPLDSEDGEFNSDAIHYIAHLVAERGRGTVRYKDANASWEDFKRRYLFEEGVD